MKKGEGCATEQVFPSPFPLSSFPPLPHTPCRNVYSLIFNFLQSKVTARSVRFRTKLVRERTGGIRICLMFKGFCRIRSIFAKQNPKTHPVTSFQILTIPVKHL